MMKKIKSKIGKIHSIKKKNDLEVDKLKFELVRVTKLLNEQQEILVSKRDYIYEVNQFLDNKTWLDPDQIKMNMNYLDELDKAEDIIEKNIEKYKIELKELNKHLFENELNGKMVEKKLKNLNMLRIQDIKKREFLDLVKESSNDLGK